MNKLLILEFLFFIGSALGWVIELFFRRFVSTKKWINPGFLTGPYLPIYGFGLCTLYLLANVDVSFINNKVLQDIIVILFMTIAMTIIEYIAGIVFIKGMKVKLWDYSDRWGNIDGIICPRFSLYWGIAGATYYFFIHSHIINAVEWLNNNLIFSFVIGYFFGIITLDVAHSFNITVKLRKFAKDNDILVKFEELKAYIREKQEERKEKIHYILAFKTNGELRKMLEEYKEKLKNNENKNHKKRFSLFVKPK
ncbi:MAG: putative ABC transporter permease [Candidatus Scatovivens sp.]